MARRLDYKRDSYEYGEKKNKKKLSNMLLIMQTVSRNCIIVIRVETFCSYILYRTFASKN